MSIAEATTQQLIQELLTRNPPQPAPRRVTRHVPMFSTFVALSDDVCAEIVIDEDGAELLGIDIPEITYHPEQ